MSPKRNRTWYWKGPSVVVADNLSGLTNGKTFHACDLPGRTCACLSADTTAQSCSCSRFGKNLFTLKGFLQRIFDVEVFLTKCFLPEPCVLSSNTLMIITGRGTMHSQHAPSMSHVVAPQRQRARRTVVQCMDVRSAVHHMHGHHGSTSLGIEMCRRQHIPSRRD